MTRLIARLMAYLAMLGSMCAPGFAQTPVLDFDSSDQRVSYAAQRLAEALEATSQDEGQRITLNVDAAQLPAETFEIAWADGALTISGGNGSGVIYGALSVAEALQNGTALENIAPLREDAALPFRAIKFNLPWDSYRSSSALDQHYETVRDVKFWEAFLDMMAQNRFNALTLWNLHPFPYMIRPTNFPESTPFTDAELAEWRALYQAIFAMAKERGIDTYLVNWNIVVSPEFAEYHGLEGTNHYPFYKGEADTSQLVQRYTRESVTQVLEEYPDLTGFGFSFGELMGGMTPRERQEWIDHTIIAGMQDAERPSRMIFRAPFSADLGQGGSTDIATERLTRDALDQLDGFEEPVWMEIKFNWSHGHSTTELVKVHGGEMDDTYFKPLPESYRVAWMMRNEDFYALRWGSPDFIREHIRRNATQDYVGGYFVGSENYIPALDYFTAGDAEVDWTYAFERQWLFYKLWGRLLYNPDTPDEVFSAEFTRRYGKRASPLLDAYELASRTQLSFASSVDFTWDFTLYGEGMMVLGGGGFQPMSVDRLIVQQPLLANWLSVEEFVARRNGGAPPEADAFTPLMLAERMESDALGALARVEVIDAGTDTSLIYEIADVRTWANLGLYYAEKIRGAVALQSYRTEGDEADRQAAVQHLTDALGYWDKVVAITRPIYKDMPLAHFNPPNNQRTDDNLFHWALLRDVIAQDIAIAKDAAREPQS